MNECKKYQSCEKRVERKRNGMERKDEEKRKGKKKA